MRSTARPRCFVSTTLAIVIFVRVALCITNLCHRDAKKLFMSAKAAIVKSDRCSGILEERGKRPTLLPVMAPKKNYLVFCSLNVF